MADFYQNGIITTMQKLTDRPSGAIEEELKRFARKRNLILLLPALVSEFDNPAVYRIIEELMNVEYLHKVVLSLDRADEEQFQKVREIMSVLPMQVDVVWHDGPRMAKLYQELLKAEFKLSTPGKGRSVWMTMGYILAHRDVYAIALHDTDIVNYNKDLLARLVYPIMHPAIDCEFSKGYYARFSDKLYGRVTRLFYTPMIRTLKRIIGYNRFLEFLDSFRYALSGEFAMINNVARTIRISPTWGLEVSMLSEVYQMASINRVNQVEVLPSYEHKHQVLEKDKPETGLIRMANEIAQVLFRVLSQDGIVMSRSFFRTTLAAYIQESRISIEKYNALSLLNGLNYDRHEEIEAVETFVEALKSAIEEFVNNPVGVPMLPAWIRVYAALPDFPEMIMEAVAFDNQ
jgi:glucosyl-3-phosphoglycerate synthase